MKQIAGTLSDIKKVKEIRVTHTVTVSCSLLAVSKVCYKDNNEDFSKFTELDFYFTRKYNIIKNAKFYIVIKNDDDSANKLFLSELDKFHYIEYKDLLHSNSVDSNYEKNV